MSFSAWPEMSFTRLAKEEACGYMRINASVLDVPKQGRDLHKLQGCALVVMRGRNLLGQG
jgi:hypothetical protein